MIGGHVDERAVPRDPGVVDEDVGATVALEQIAGEARWRVLGRDIDLVGGAADSVRDLGQGRTLRGDVEDHDVCTIASQRFRDRGADAPGGTGDDGDSILERVVPIRGRGDSGGADPNHLAIDVGRATGEEEADRRLEAALAAFGHIYKVGGGAVTRFLGGRADEAVEGALRGSGLWV